MHLGFGKSVLLSSVIEELQKVDDDRLVLYFFCKTGDDSTQRAGAIFRNFIAHIYQKIHDHIPKLLEESTKILAKAQNKGGVGGSRLEYAKSVKNLQPVLEDLAKLHGKPVFIILDALDECNDRRKEGLTDSLHGMIDTSRVPNGQGETVLDWSVQSKVKSSQRGEIGLTKES